MARNTHGDCYARLRQVEVQQDVKENSPQMNFEFSRDFALLERLDSETILEIYQNSEERGKKRLYEEKRAVVSARIKEDLQRDNKRIGEDRELFYRMESEKDMDAGACFRKYALSLMRNKRRAKELHWKGKSEPAENVRADGKNSPEDVDSPLSDPPEMDCELDWNDSVSGNETDTPGIKSTPQEVEFERGRALTIQNIEDWESVVKESGRVYVLRCECFNNENRWYGSKGKTEDGIRKTWKKHSNEFHEDENGIIRKKDVVKKFGYLVEDATLKWYDDFRKRFDEKLGRKRKKTSSRHLSERPGQFGGSDNSADFSEREDGHRHDNGEGSKVSSAENQSVFVPLEDTDDSCDGDADEDPVELEGQDGPKNLNHGKEVLPEGIKNEEIEDRGLFMTPAPADRDLDRNYQPNLHNQTESSESQDGLQTIQNIDSPVFHQLGLTGPKGPKIPPNLTVVTSNRSSNQEMSNRAASPFPRKRSPEAVSGLKQKRRKIITSSSEEIDYDE
ncbi:hypothetical protein ONS95_014937 [Cadophora gregata]|uniref:uncharacterized protein n=1 Tax=Cadophora gregata TaxID=51156 RepID=UPI0026DB96A8|nr:uncharacterized protein ONS95_014937 [Cadophora gregata]KAK0113241.1 hypothetical protein ONS95_014937 [Cadophora gregata]KAK0125283.1 hypothetical protein ONS96_009138 [Cadophora gregata f. sp. sojae]